MKLTRRDALEAAIIGTAGGVAALAGSEIAVSEGDSDRHEDDRIDDTEIATMVAIGEVVYPSAVNVTSAFITTYTDRLTAEHRDAVTGSIEGLNAHATQRHGKPFHRIEAVSRRESELRALGADRVASTPEGTLAERVRDYLVDGLLLALFTSPTGSELVGIRNPIGHPGGYEDK